jgi:hypothetical protein
MEPWRDDGGNFESRKSKIGHLIRRSSEERNASRLSFFKEYFFEE